MNINQQWVDLGVKRQKEKKKKKTVQGLQEMLSNIFKTNQMTYK